MRLDEALSVLLFSSDQPLSAQALLKLLQVEFGDATLEDVDNALKRIKKQVGKLGLVVESNALGYRIQVASPYLDWAYRLYQQTPPKLSRALLETLVIIAHRQPITRAEIEVIRGVAVSSSIMGQLKAYDWVRTVGVKEVPGHPAQWGTTSKLLQDLGFTSKQALIDHLEQLIESFAYKDGGES